MLSFLFTITLICKAQEFNLPIKFQSDYEMKESLGESLKTNDLKEILTITFDGKRLLCKWQSVKIFCDKEISNYPIIKNFKGETSIIYALEEKNNDGLISYILIERRFESFAMVDSIKFPYMSNDGMIYNYTIFTGYTDY